jgi:hypothetical protein
MDERVSRKEKKREGGEGETYYGSRLCYSIPGLRISLLMDIQGPSPYVHFSQFCLFVKINNCSAEKPCLI